MQADKIGGPPSLERGNGVATIRFNRPDQYNRLNGEDLNLVFEFLRGLNEDATIRVIVITGSGPSFSSGFDLRDFDGPILGHDEDNLMERVADYIETMRPIVIAKLNGPVYGGSTDLALACDFRIGTTACKMFMPAARLGLHYYGHGIRRWISRLGLGAAKLLFLTAKEIDARRMSDIGFMDECVEPAELDATVDGLVERLLSMAPKVVLTMKQTLNETGRGEYDHVRANALFKESLRSADLREALNAFGEKRKPRFIGA